MTKTGARDAEGEPEEEGWETTASVHSLPPPPPPEDEESYYGEERTMWSRKKKVGVAAAGLSVVALALGLGLGLGLDGKGNEDEPEAGPRTAAVSDGAAVPGDYVAAAARDIDYVGEGYCLDENDAYFGYLYGNGVSEVEPCGIFCESLPDIGLALVGFELGEDCHCLYDDNAGNEPDLDIIGPLEDAYNISDWGFDDWDGTPLVGKGSPVGTDGDSGYFCYTFTE